MKGFTLIEILVAVTILLILSSIGVSNFTTFNDTQGLKQAALDLKSSLRTVQNKAFSGEKPTGCASLTGWRITFTATTYTTEPACAAASPTASQRTTTLPTGITFSPTPTSVTFAVVTGATNLTTVQSLHLAQPGSSKRYTIGVGSRGEITDEGFSAYVPPIPTPTPTPAAPTPTSTPIVPTPTRTPTPTPRFQISPPPCGTEC